MKAVNRSKFIIIPFKYKIVPALFAFTLISLYIWKTVNFGTHIYSGDIGLYLNFGHNIFKDNASDISNYLYEDLIVKTGLENRYEGWIPNPLYTAIVTICITILGSKILFSLTGFIFGVLNIVLVTKCIEKLRDDKIFKLNDFSIVICTFLYAIYPENITNTVFFSVSCIYSTFIFACFLQEKYIYVPRLGA